MKAAKVRYLSHLSSIQVKKTEKEHGGRLSRSFGSTVGSHRIVQTLKLSSVAALLFAS